MVVTVEKVSVPPLVIGETPHWDIDTQSLYLVDVMGSAIVRYDLPSDQAFVAKLDVTPVSFIIPVAGSNGKFIIGSHHKIYLIDWDGCSDKIDSMEVLCELTDQPEINVVNDAKCDTTGRLWFGTYNTNVIFFGDDTEATAKFYSYSKEEGCRVQATDIKVSNGLTWDPEFNSLYLIDTLTYSIGRFEYNKDGSIGNHEVVYSMEDKNIASGFPDGMTIDKDGNLWVALFGRSEVVCIDPSSGEILDKVDMPACHVTSVAWGGPNLEDLYVTTGNFRPEGSKFPKMTVVSPENDGCVFKITGLSTSGLPMNRFKL
ncbi:putative sugar lactone lactonase YvrE [Halyomorpha halys]|uniref:putative sugar lactone lactonase YvrE n=1 Tax=Halyomorpha halys TaxID=286706 RepID=UPI0006D50F8D|nr:uncharacterized protein LOC106689058 isoform X1 [Halyomorpha halys]